jgi:CMP/dCMP kinase
MTIYNIITLDGPVGVGKSSVARDLSRCLGYRHIDTGAMYRAVTLAAMKRGIDLLDKDAVAEIVQECDVELVYDDNEKFTVLLDGQDVTKAIREPEVSKNTSPVADNAAVRRNLVSLQRALGLQGPSILEGRDISTVVFPDAYWKFYLDASIEERTRRRVDQYRNSGKSVDLQKTMESIEKRDHRDRTRTYGPLKIADDAIVLDTTEMSREEVVGMILGIVKDGKKPDQRVR